MPNSTYMPESFRGCFAFVGGHLDLKKNILAYASERGFRVSVRSISHRRLDTRALVPELVEGLHMERVFETRVVNFLDADDTDFLFTKTVQGSLEPRATFVVLIHRYREAICIEVYGGSEPGHEAYKVVEKAVKDCTAKPDSQTAIGVLMSNGGGLTTRQAPTSARPTRSPGLGSRRPITAWRILSTGDCILNLLFVHH